MINQKQESFQDLWVDRVTICPYQGWDRQFESGRGRHYLPIYIFSGCALANKKVGKLKMWFPSKPFPVVRMSFRYPLFVLLCRPIMEILLR